MAYLKFDGYDVSKAWFELLTAARRDGVDFTLNSGHRTMARQWELWRLWQSGRGNRAAFPSLFAPHIRAGQYHAIDVEGSQALINWAARHGVTLTRTVSGESWHLEGFGFAGKFPVLDPLKRGSRGHRVRFLTFKLYKLGYLKKTAWVFGPHVAEAVKRFQRSRRLPVDETVGPKTTAALDLARRRQKRGKGFTHGPYGAH